MLYGVNGKIRLTKEQCESLVDNNPHIINYVMELMDAIIRRPGYKWDEIENLKWLDTRQAAFYIGKEKSYLDWMCNKNLIEYNTVAGKREFDIEVLRKWRSDNTVKHRAMTQEKIDEFYNDWARQQAKKKK